MGRSIYVVVPPGPQFNATLVYDCKVQRVKQFLPAGPVAHSEPSATDGIRSDHIVQLYTTTGLRTLAVAHIHLKDPRKTGRI